MHERHGIDGGRRRLCWLRSSEGSASRSGIVRGNGKADPRRRIGVLSLSRMKLREATKPILQSKPQCSGDLLWRRKNVFRSRLQRTPFVTLGPYKCILAMENLAIDKVCHWPKLDKIVRCYEERPEASVETVLSAHLAPSLLGMYFIGTVDEDTCLPVEV